jgi:hypothetical protein
MERLRGLKAAGGNRLLAADITRELAEARGGPEEAPLAALLRAAQRLCDLDASAAAADARAASNAAAAAAAAVPAPLAPAIAALRARLECPISCRLMADPVVLVESGQSYDRAHIGYWCERARARGCARQGGAEPHAAARLQRSPALSMRPL